MVGGLFPSQLLESIEVLEKMVVWRAGGSGEDIPEPQHGLDDQFDLANAHVNKVKAKLDKQLDKARKQFGDDKQ